MSDLEKDLVHLTATGSPSAEKVTPAPMDAALKAKWVFALRSGEFKQVEGRLHKPNQGYCCLGVLCAVSGATFEKAGRDWWPILDGKRMDAGNGDEYLAPEIGIPPAVQRTLAEMNDAGKPFFDIADYIEANL